VIVPGTEISASAPIGNLTAFLFTDARGRIVLADDFLTKTLGYSHPSEVKGKPLHVMVTPMERATDVLRELESTGRVYDCELTLLDAREHEVDVILSAGAAHSLDGDFIGADIKIRRVEKAASDQPAPASHNAAIASHIQTLDEEATIANHRNERAADVLLYFVAQIRALYVLLSRMGGPRIAAALEEVLSKIITQKNWPMAILGGHVTTDEGGIPEEAYLELLRMVISFGTNIVGRAVLVREMQVVDENLSNYAREIAGEAGLRQFLS
jgi:hypothetical protein